MLKNFFLSSVLMILAIPTTIVSEPYCQYDLFLCVSLQKYRNLKSFDDLNNNFENIAYEIAGFYENKDNFMLSTIHLNLYNETNDENLRMCVTDITENVSAQNNMLVVLVDNVTRGEKKVLLNNQKTLTDQNVALQYICEYFPKRCYAISDTETSIDNEEIKRDVKNAGFCYCPFISNPHISNDNEQCSFRQIGQSCAPKCEENFISIPSKVTCQKNWEWQNFECKQLYNNIQLMFYLSCLGLTHILVAFLTLTCVRIKRVFDPIDIKLSSFNMNDNVINANTIRYEGFEDSEIKVHF